MRFDSFIEQHRKTMTLLEEVGRKQGIEITRKEGKVNIKTHPERLSPQAAHGIRMLDNMADLVESYIFSQVIAFGPKVFRPKRYDFEALEHMNLSLNFEDYNQPFSSMVIELPENYIAKKRTICPQAGELSVDCSMVYPKEHEPSFVVVHHNKEYNFMFLQVTFTSMQSLKTSLIPPPEQEMEEYLKGMSIGDIYPNSLDVAADEWEVVNAVCKSALNYCLLVDEIGIKRVGPSNPSYYARLQKHQNRLGCKLHPIIYDIHHEVELVDKVIVESTAEGSGGQKASHWRRGHYRMQPHGPNYSLRKRIRIKPCMIHPEGLLPGQGANYKS